MKAVALCRDSAPALRDLVVPPPQPPRGRDLLIRVEALSVNPVDGKLRAATPAASLDTPRILGGRSDGRGGQPVRLR